MNSIKTWRQGRFIDHQRYSNWTEDQKKLADKLEKFKVRPFPTENAICTCSDPDDAKWISSRLKLAAELEQLTYDYATGKTDGSELIKFVMDKVKNA